MKDPFTLRTFTFSGSSRQIGRQHGEALRADVATMLDNQFSFLAEAGLSPGDFCDVFYGETRFLQAAEVWTPRVLEMVRGIAEGANQDFRMVFLWQLLDEISWVLRRKRDALAQPGANRCSVLGAYGTLAEPAILAQNADMGKAVDGAGLVLHLKNTETGLETLTVTLPGLVGVYGLNNRAVGVCLNAMGFFMNKSTAGLGTLFVAQGILERTGFEAVDGFIRAAPHATGEVYTVGFPGLMACYEGSANRVERCLPANGRQYVCHTNHPLVNTDVELTAEGEMALPADVQVRLQRAKDNTAARLASLQASMRDLAPPLTVEKTVAALSMHADPENPVCRHKREEAEDMTNFCIVMELGDDPCMHVSSGPPCRSEFRTFRF